MATLLLQLMLDFLAVNVPNNSRVKTQENYTWRDFILRRGEMQMQILSEGNPKKLGRVHKKM